MKILAKSETADVYIVEHDDPARGVRIANLTRGYVSEAMSKAKALSLRYDWDTSPTVKPGLLERIKKLRGKA